MYPPYCYFPFCGIKFLNKHHVLLTDPPTYERRGSALNIITPYNLQCRNVHIFL